MRPNTNDHPPGSSIGSECFGELRKDSEIGSNVAGIGSLHLLGTFNTDLLVRSERSDGDRK